MPDLHSSTDCLLTLLFSSAPPSSPLPQIDQQREELSHDVRLAIGTPNRLLKLSQAGFLKWSRCRLVVWDIGKSRKLQIAEKQQKRRIKNKIKAGVAVENPHIPELSDAQKGQPR